MFGHKGFSVLVLVGRALALAVVVVTIVTACPYEPPALTNIADPNASTLVEAFPEGLNDPLRAAILDSAETHGYRYTQELSILDANDAGLERLDGIEFLFSLEDLYAHGNNLESVAPLASFDSLNEVILSNNDIVSVEPLAGLRIDRRIRLMNNRIDDISPLGQLNAPVGLGVQNQDTDPPLTAEDYYELLSGLEGERLRYLQVGEFAIDLDAEQLSLERFPELDDLRLSAFTLENPQIIAETVPQMYQLRFDGIDFAGDDFAGLVADLDELRHLELFNANEASVEDIQSLGVENVMRLSYFATTDSDLSDLTFLPERPDMDILRVESSSLQSLDGLERIGGFRELLLAFNPELGGQNDLDLLLELSGPELMDLRDSGFTEGDIEAIEAAFPDTVILF